MKRLILVPVALVAIAVPATAVSSPSDEGFSAKRGTFGITFDVLTNNGKPKKVGNFAYENAEATCETGGPLSIDGSGFGTQNNGPNAAAKVEDKEFKKTYTGESPGGGETKQTFTGKFKNHNTKVEGTMRVKGDFPNSSATNCDSGKINYLAQ